MIKLKKVQANIKSSMGWGVEQQEIIMNKELIYTIDLIKDKTGCFKDTDLWAYKTKGDFIIHVFHITKNNDGKWPDNDHIQNTQTITPF